MSACSSPNLQKNDLYKINYFLLFVININISSVYTAVRIELFAGLK